jgi:hypothetical protein
MIGNGTPSIHNRIPRPIIEFPSCVVELFQALARIDYAEIEGWMLSARGPSVGRPQPTLATSRAALPTGVYSDLRVIQRLPLKLARSANRLPSYAGQLCFRILIA